MNLEIQARLRPGRFGLFWHPWHSSMLLAVWPWLLKLDHPVLCINSREVKIHQADPSQLHSLVVTEWHFAFSQFLFSLFIAVSNFWIHERGQEFTRPCSVNPSIWTIIVLTEVMEGLKIWGGQAIIQERSLDGSDFAPNSAKIWGQLPPSAPWLPTALTEITSSKQTSILADQKKSALLIHSVQHTSNKTQVPN